MKTINLFIKFQFTSFSPDAQPISLGIVSGWAFPYKITFAEFDLDRLPISTKELIKEINPEFIECVGYNDIRGAKVAKYQIDIPLYSNLSDTRKIQFFLPEQYIESKSFYAEFTDFDLNRCDDWVKENVVGRLKYYGTPKQDKMFIDSSIDEGTIFGSQNTAEIKGALHKWLSQFSDYNIQFVCDCGTFDWYWMLQLLAEWEVKDIHPFEKMNGTTGYFHCKAGLPKLPANISPVPQDLNDLILYKYLNLVVSYSTAKDAFNANRETLMNILGCCHNNRDMYDIIDNTFVLKAEKHNALWDARVIKAIYEKLK